MYPFIGICIEVAILCTIIFVYEKRKSTEELINENETDLPTEKYVPFFQFIYLFLVLYYIKNVNEKNSFALYAKFLLLNHKNEKSNFILRLLSLS